MIAASDALPIAALAAQWQRVLDDLDIDAIKLDADVLLAHDVEGPGWWLRRSRQWLVVREELDPWHSAALRRLHNLLAPRIHLADGLGDLRIVVALPAGDFLGLRGGLAPHTEGAWIERPTLFQCKRCGGWWITASERPAGCGCCSCIVAVTHAIRDRITPFPPPPAAQPATRCPPRKWVGVRRVS